MPVVFRSAGECDKVFLKLKERGVMARQYFAPSLSRLDVFNTNGEYTTVSNDLAYRVLCLPLYYNLLDEELEQVCIELKNALRQ